MINIRRKVGAFDVAAIGLGCMSLSHGYARPPAPEEGAKLLHRALDLGYDFLDTAALYGIGGNETLIGETLKGRRNEFVLASKCGFVVTDGGKGRRIDGSPQAIRQTLDESLSRLQVDHIDLYYLHRLDPNTPIEDSVGELSRAVEAGKIGSIGLSEVSAATLRRAHTAHPIAAIQTEYSLWSRNAEIAVLDACHELGTTFVAFSPVARGFLADAVHSAEFWKGDIRGGMPRFQEPNLSANLRLLEGFRAIAHELGFTPAQLSLAWLLTIDDTIVPIPGTASIAHLEENFVACAMRLAPEIMERLDALINPQTVNGHRYSDVMQATIDTEEFV